MFKFKNSKTDKNYIEVFIMLTAINDSIYLVTILYFPFTHNLQSFYTKLFIFNNIFFL